MISSHFAGSVSEHGDMQKRKFPKEGVRRVPVHVSNNSINEK